MEERNTQQAAKMQTFRVLSELGSSLRACCLHTQEGPALLCFCKAAALGKLLEEEGIHTFCVGRSLFIFPFITDVIFCMAC